MKIRWITHPVGQVIENEHIDNFVDSMKALWDASNTKPAWWDAFRRINLSPVTNFLLNCLDDLISYADSLNTASGADKKATVLFAIGRIYDYIVNGVLPVWARPFAGVIREYVISILVSAAIDWIVEKYKDGQWNKKDKNFIEVHWTKLHVQMFGVPLGGHRPKF